MTKGGNRDIAVGGMVFILAALVFWGIYVYGAERHHNPTGYTIEAAFHRLEGIGAGSPVRLSGVVVGKVSHVSLAKDYRAVTTLILERGIALPTDSAALIRTDGLLGSKYIDLQPGGDETVLQPGERISYTQDAMAVEDLLEMVIREGKAKRAKAASAPPCPPPAEEPPPGQGGLPLQISPFTPTL